MRDTVLAETWPHVSSFLCWAEGSFLEFIQTFLVCRVSTWLWGRPAAPAGGIRSSPLVWSLGARERQRGSCSPCGPSPCGIPAAAALWVVLLSTYYILSQFPYINPGQFSFFQLTKERFESWGCSPAQGLLYAWGPCNAPGAAQCLGSTPSGDAWQLPCQGGLRAPAKQGEDALVLLRRCICVELLRLRREAEPLQNKKFNGGAV